MSVKPKTEQNPRTALSNKIEVKTDENSVKFLALGVPYNGPDYLQGKDFHGQYFNAETDYADHTGVVKVYATLDHAVTVKEDDKIVLAPQKMVIGSATYLKSDDYGRWYEISLAEGEHYDEVLKLLQELESKKMLRASSQAIPTTVTADANGHIKSWVVSEVAFTTHAANPLAVVEVMKSHSFDTSELEAFIKAAESVQLEEESEETVEEESEEVTPEEVTEQPFDEFIEETFGESSEEVVEEEGVVETDLGEIVEVSKVDERLAAIEEAVKSMQSSKIWAYLDAYISFEEEELPKLFNLMSELSSKTTSMEKGLRNFADIMKNEFNVRVEHRAKELEGESVPERQASAQAEEEMRKYMQRNFYSNVRVNSQSSNIIPDHAPGGK